MKNFRKGFTLLEILLVVGIIAILAGIVIVAINPSKQLAQVRNTERKSDLKQLNNAITQYYIDHSTYPSSINSAITLTEICDTGTATSTDGLNCTDLVDLTPLVPIYITAIPKDPLGPVTAFLNKIINTVYAATGGTGYYVMKDSNKIILNTERAELGVVIAIGTTTAMAVEVVPTGVYINECQTIDTPGTYILNQSLVSSSGSCITINASDVTLDGNSTYSIETTSSNWDDTAVKVSPGVTGTVIENIELIISGAGAGVWNRGAISDINATINVNGLTGYPSPILNSGLITNISGTININSSNGWGIEMAPGSEISNFGATINNYGDVGINSSENGSVTINDTATINNYGDAAIQNYNGTITINGTMTINNYGSVGIINYSLFNGSGTLNGDITLESGSTLDLSSGLTVTGTITDNGGTIIYP